MVYFEDDATKTVVPLSLLKIDRVTIEGIRFTRRIYNAQQITTSGKAHVSVKLKKRHLAISDITIMDANQSVYFNWKKVRKYKSKSKTYNHSISISPYSTVVIHTKTSKVQRADYEY